MLLLRIVNTVSEFVFQTCGRVINIRPHVRNVRPCRVYFCFVFSEKWIPLRCRWGWRRSMSTKSLSYCWSPTGN